MRNKVALVSDGKPVVMPPAAAAPRLASSNRTSITINWDTVPATLGYKVEYRKTGTTPWILSVHTNGTSAAVTDLTTGQLDAGTSYDIRVTAVNEAGGGTPGSLIASTTGPAQ